MSEITPKHQNICPSCSTELSDEAKFCPSCGNSLGADTQTPATVQKGALTKDKKYNYGFSYVTFFKIGNIIISAIVGITLLYFADETYNPVFLFSGLITPVLLYWILTFPIKIFENMAIMAKNSTEILNRMNNTK